MTSPTHQSHREPSADRSVSHEAPGNSSAAKSTSLKPTSADRAIGAGADDAVEDAAGIKRGKRPRYVGAALVGILVAAAIQAFIIERDFWLRVFAGDPARQVPLNSQGPRQPGFQLHPLNIPLDEILPGGPRKDGIPALTDPRLLPADAAPHVEDTDRVAGVLRDGEARAYPLKILNYHEIVNEKIGDQPLAVTYCPLCDSVAVFDRQTELGLREFGVSGLLYNSNVLMYDRGGDPESLWSQAMKSGVSGPGSDSELKPLPVELTTWKSWRARYPKTKVLSDQTGYRRDYRRNPYKDYMNDNRLRFPVDRLSDRLPAKSRVLGVWAGAHSKAFPVDAFAQLPTQTRHQVGGRSFTLVYDRQAHSLRVTDADPGVGWMYAFWFAWYAFNVDTEVFSPEQ